MAQKGLLTSRSCIRTFLWPNAFLARLHTNLCLKVPYVCSSQYMSQLVLKRDITGPLDVSTFVSDM